MSTSYTGKAGQLFAMSEFLMLGYNVAIPEVDRGDDIFVVRDSMVLLVGFRLKQQQPEVAGKDLGLNFLYLVSNSSPRQLQK